MNTTIRGTCLAQHADAMLVVPGEPICNGYPHIGPIKFTDVMEWSDIWAALRVYLPPDWTVVAVESAVKEDSPSMRWWLYTEPSSVAEPDQQRRLDQRRNALGATFEEAGRKLIDHYAEQMRAKLT